MSSPLWGHPEPGMVVRAPKTYGENVLFLVVDIVEKAPARTGRDAPEVVLLELLGCSTDTLPKVYVDMMEHGNHLVWKSQMYWRIDNPGMASRRSGWTPLSPLEALAAMSGNLPAADSETES